MTLAEVQAYVSERIMENAALADFGAPIVYSHFLDDEEVKKLIDERLRTKGVCIEIGSVEADGDKESPNNRTNKVVASFPVFVAESPKVTHTPKEMPLVTAVATAVQKRVDAWDQNPRCVGYEAAKSENGYVLHTLMFTVPAIL